MFQFLLTYGWWPLPWSNVQAGGQWKRSLLKRCPYGAQPYGNDYGNLRVALK